MQHGLLAVRAGACEEGWGSRVCGPARVNTRHRGPTTMGRQAPGVGGVHSLQAGQDGGRALLQQVNAHQHIAVAG